MDYAMDALSKYWVSDAIFRHRRSWCRSVCRRTSGTFGSTQRPLYFRLSQALQGILAAWSHWGSLSYLTYFSQFEMSHVTLSLSSISLSLSLCMVFSCTPGLFLNNLELFHHQQHWLSFCLIRNFRKNENFLLVIY